ncbi:MAG: DUF4162 domain-containing protein [Candidatus Gracilibacteria bacterium]|nr:DUF4162 domain-containing protein [Candidatus Gracilibacteria bacterium]
MGNSCKSYAQAPCDFSGGTLDIVAKQNLRDIINEINLTENTTIFLTSHDLQDVENICDRVIIINHGKMLYDGTLDKLKKAYIKKKIIKVQFETNTFFKKKDYMTIIESKENFIKMEIPNSKECLNETFTLLNTEYKIEDISIENPTIEEIIKEFY